MPNDKDGRRQVNGMSADDDDPERQIRLFRERVGPIYSVDSVARLLDCTEEEVRAGIRDRILLAIQLADGVTALPARQFDEAGSPLPGLRELSTTLDPEGTDPLSVALLLFTRSEYWGGGTTAEVMRAGRVSEVVSVAERIHRSHTGP
jgi:hypothetical protein